MSVEQVLMGLQMFKAFESHGLLMPETGVLPASPDSLYLRLTLEKMRCQVALEILIFWSPASKLLANQYEIADSLFSHLF